MIEFSGRKKKAYFEGWYFKHQGKDGTLVFIPARHMDKKGRLFATLQVITEQGSELMQYPIEEFGGHENPLCVKIGENRFSEIGCSINFSGSKLKVKGSLRYSDFLKPSRDVMGPFRFLPFLQCRHQIFSLIHCVNGKIEVNGKSLVFRNGFGYVEGDRGCSFPKRYVWSQCTGKNFSMMISVADVPVLGRSITGCTGVICYKEKEYRIATFLGARVVYADSDYAAVSQSGYLLEVHRLCGELEGEKLYAPQDGDMVRIVRESLACMVKYRLSKDGEKIFSFISERASFESDWEDKG